jgi:hypothetical protein
MKSPANPFRLVLAAAFPFLAAVPVARAQTSEILHRFNLSSNFALGANPTCTPFFDTDGTMYGTCNNGGLPPFGLGTVWKRTPAGVVSRVGAFNGTPGGQYPTCGVLKAGDGNLYGPNSGGPGFTGTGAAYRMTSAGVVSSVVDWTGNTGSNPGSNPWFTIVGGPGGIIYGSCYFGGTTGAGTVWRIAADGTYTLLHTMTGTPAAAPASNPKSLAVLADGTLYFSAQRHIFRRTTAGVLSEVLLMNPATQGDEVLGMVASSDGNLYGIANTSSGNVYRLFRLSPAGVFTSLQTLPTVASGDNLNANYCGYGVFVEASDGNFYTMNYRQVIRLSRTGSFTALPQPGVNTGSIRGLREGPDGFIYGILDDDNNQDSTGGGAIFRFAMQAAVPEIALEQPAGTDLVDGTASISFGTVNTGSSSAAKTFTIKNTGTSALSVTGASLTGGDTGDFTVNTTGMASSVTGGGSTTFTVTFTPTAAGARTATLQIANNDANEAPFDITLTGTGNVPIDADTDGLPDAWEITHFGSAGATTGTADADGDGLNNFGEYAFGLNPNSGNLSGLPQPSKVGGLLTMTVTKQPFVNYTVVGSTDLSSGSFTTAGLTIVTDTATTLTVRETTAGARNFMKIQAVSGP